MLVEKALVLLIYIVATVITLVSVRCKLHLAASVTIILFLLCLLLNFIVYTLDLYNALPGDSDTKHRLLYEILIPVTKGILLGIQYFYTFEIRVVLLKVLSDTPSSYYKDRFRSLVILSAGFVVLTISYGLEIFENVVILGTDGTYDDEVLTVFIRLLGLATELPLFWFMFTYLRKFSEIRREHGGMTSRHSKVAMYTIYFLLAINAANTVAYNTVNLIIALESDNTNAKNFEDKWLVFSTIITDCLVFVNAIAFLALFKSINSNRRSHTVKRPAILSSLNPDNNRLSTGSDGTVGTGDVNHILQFGGHEIERVSQFSKDPDSKSSTNDSRPLLSRLESSFSTMSATTYSEAENPLQDYLLALVNRTYL